MNKLFEDEPIKEEPTAPDKRKAPITIFSVLSSILFNKGFYTKEELEHLELTPALLSKFIADYHLEDAKHEFILFLADTKLEGYFLYLESKRIA